MLSKQSLKILAFAIGALIILFFLVQLSLIQEAYDVKEENHKITPMDSYLIDIDHDGTQEIILTQLETPIRKHNEPLTILTYDLGEKTLTPHPISLPISGTHIRNVFSSDSFIYFVDHGADAPPFPGGRVKRYSTLTKEKKTYPELNGRFNFSGSALNFQGQLYEIFVGINFALLFIDGQQSAHFDRIIKEVNDPQGFLSAQFFVHNNQLKLFLGGSDIAFSAKKKHERFDLIISFNKDSINYKKLERPVPWNWATVYAALDLSPQGQQIIKVAYHNVGFNDAALGYYLIKDEIEYVSLASSDELSLSNQWIPKFELAHSQKDDQWKFFVPLRRGSQEGLCQLATITAQNHQIEKIDFCPLGIHRLAQGLIFIGYDLSIWRSLEEL